MLLTSINPTPGPPRPQSAVETDENPHGRSERIMDLFEPAIGNTLNTSPLNVRDRSSCYVYAVWVEHCHGSTRLPTGMQVVAKRLDEASVFKAAKVREVGGHSMNRWSAESDTDEHIFFRWACLLHYSIFLEVPGPHTAGEHDVQLLVRPAFGLWHSQITPYQTDG